MAEETKLNPVMDLPGSFKEASPRMSMDSEADTPSALTSPQDTNITLKTDALLESIPVPAFLIGKDARIVAANSRGRSMVRSAAGSLCYESLAGLGEACPMCPLEDLLAGRADPLIDVTDERSGQECRVNVRLLEGEGQDGVLLETIQYLPDEASHGTIGKGVERETQAFLQREHSLRLIRAIQGRGHPKKRVHKILKRLKQVMLSPAGVNLWIELDGEIFGQRDVRADVRRFKCEIRVERKTRGFLHVDYWWKTQLPGSEKDFLRNIAAMMARQMALMERQTRLRNASSRYRKLAGNLAKEMWSRTHALAKETGYLEGILRSSQDVIITTDLESRIVEFNPGAEQLLGYTAEEMQGCDVADLWENAEEREQIMLQVRAEGGVTNHETRLKTKSGELREISLTLSMLKDGEGTVLGTVGVSKDISRELAIRRELEALNQNFRETINFINHESKNSLMVIGGFVRRLMDQEQDPKRKEHLQIIYHHSKFLEAMSRDFLLMAELDQGDLSCRKEIIDDLYEEVIRPAMLGLKDRYPDSFESYGTLPADLGSIRLMADRDLLEVVYRNLFGNALKYRAPGGKILYGVRERPSCYVLNVWNAGPGVPVDQVEKIFEKFYRIRDETTRGKRGTGLGLYNIRRIIEAHGGSIWCTTLPGEWIDFVFELPKQ